MISILLFSIPLSEVTLSELPQYNDKISVVNLMVIYSIGLWHKLCMLML